MAREIETTAEKLIAGGNALGRHADGRAIMLRGALPAERVRARIVHEKRDFLRAEAIAVLTASADRVAPACPAVARGCGGCDWQHIAAPAQAAYKRAIVLEALQRTAGLKDSDVRPGVQIPDIGYRTTLRLAVDRQGRLGHREAGGNRVVSIDHCLVAHPGLDELLYSIRLPGAREVLLRVGARTGDRLLRWWPDQLPVPKGLPRDIRTGPDAFVDEVVCGVRLRVSADSFFQSSPEAAEALIDAVKRAAGPAATWGDGPVVDAFGGVGLFAATVPPVDRERTIIESNPAACANARANLAELPARVIERGVEEWTPRPAGLVIADPARAGLGRAAVTNLTATGTPVLVLVSCDPVAFARDTRLLMEQGYRLDYAEVLDLFPQTHHVEVVSRFLPAHG